MLRRLTRGESTAVDILVVCAGNYCRSPLAEGLLRHYLPADFTIASAGILGFSADGAHAEIQKLLAGTGLEPEWIAEFRPRKLRTGDVANARLVLTAEADHRRDVVQMVPDAANRTFTLKEFSRLIAGATPIGGTPRERFSNLVQMAAERLSSQPEADFDDDIPDPMGMPPRHFDDCYAQINDSLAWVGLVDVALKG